MKIAVTGKGGAGKTTIAGTLARHLARSGESVVAVDGDPNPNLGISLGLSADDVERMEPILNALLASGYTHDQPPIPPDELLARYGVEAPDGVRLVATGKMERPTDACLCCGSHMTTREFFGTLPDVGRTVVADLEAGINDLAWVRPQADDVVLVVAEPSAKAVDVAARSRRMADDLGVKRIVAVANRSSSREDVDTLAEALGVDEVFTIPEDRAVEEAGNRGVAAIDAASDSPAVRAIRELAERLRRS